MTQTIGDDRSPPKTTISSEKHPLFYRSFPSTAFPSPLFPFRTSVQSRSMSITKINSQKSMDHFEEKKIDISGWPRSSWLFHGCLTLPPPLLLLLATPSLHLIQAWCLLPFFRSERSCQKQKSAQGQAERERETAKQANTQTNLLRRRTTRSSRYGCDGMRRKKRALGRLRRFAFLTHVDLHWSPSSSPPPPPSSQEEEEGRSQSDGGAAEREEEAMRVDASVAQVLQVAKLRPIRAWCSLSSCPCPQQAQGGTGTLSLDSSGGGGGRLSLVVNEETFDGLGLPGRRRQAHPKKRKRGRRRGSGQGEYELSFSLHKADDVAGLERVMAYFSEPQHFLIASVPPVALRSLFPTYRSGETILRAQHKRQERDLLVPRQLLSESALGGVKEADAFVALVGLQSQGAQMPHLLADLSREQKKEEEEEEGVRGSPPPPSRTTTQQQVNDRSNNGLREGGRGRVASQKVLTESLRGAAISREAAGTVLERAASLVSSACNNSKNKNPAGMARWAIVSVSGYSSYPSSSSPCLPPSAAAAAAAAAFSFLSVSLLFLPGGRVHVVQ